MNKELEKYYENRFKIFSEPGWIDLLVDVKQMKEVIDNLRSCKGSDDLFFKKGQLDILDWLLTIQSASEQAYDELLKEEN